MNFEKKMILGLLTAYGLGTNACAQTAQIAQTAQTAQTAQSINCSGTLAKSAAISKIAAFSNMRYSGEHVSGYTIMLWRADTRLLGIMLAADGLAGDTPTGELHELCYDEKSGAIRFTAKLSTGTVFSPLTKKEEAARDLFTFQGKLSKTQLSGLLTLTTLNDPQSKPQQTRLNLRASRQEAGFMGDEKTYGAWRSNWDEILKFRGPKW
ncbi:hypothetical protein ACO0LC_11065 [Undibacterium sp. JH2W]|uniref:hypothetical protein n=1 Tax=Undibacterium sp. JH2W TaxID=3413037 RepID=UPI003BF1F8FB